MILGQEERCREKVYRNGGEKVNKWRSGKSVKFLKCHIYIMLFGPFSGPLLKCFTCIVKNCSWKLIHSDLLATPDCHWILQVWQHTSVTPNSFSTCLHGQTFIEAFRILSSVQGNINYTQWIHFLTSHLPWKHTLPWCVCQTAEQEALLWRTEWCSAVLGWAALLPPAGCSGLT